MNFKKLHTATEVKPKQQNTLEKSPITINSNTQSQSSDSDTENFKTITLESKKCNHWKWLFKYLKIVNENYL